MKLEAEAFCAFLAHQAVRRIGGRSWRLVIAGDLFDLHVGGDPGLRRA